MIEMIAAFALSAGPQAAPRITERTRARIEACRNHQTQSFMLLGKLDRPDTDRAAAAAEARAIEADCNTAALDLTGDPWAAPCLRSLLVTAAHAGALQAVYLGVRPRTDLPGLIYQDGVSDGYRCLQIIEGQQP